MPDPERKLLPGHPPRGGGSAPGCVSALLIVFGLPFMAAGAFMARLALGPGPAPSPEPAPPWVLPVMGAVFFIPGLLITLLGVRTLLGSRGHGRRHFANPNEPWLADQWDPHGVREQPRHSLAVQFGSTAFLALFLSPFNYFVFADPVRAAAAPFFAKGLVGLFDLVLVLMIVGIFMALWHRVRYGRSRLAFGSFPFFTGQPLRVRLHTGKRLGAFEKLVFTLRCIEERTETVSTSKGRSTRVLCEQVWADEQTMATSWALEEGEVPVSFQLPEGDLGTRLGEPPQRYWELEVAAHTPGLDFGTVFPLPIYARPRG